MSRIATPNKVVAFVITGGISNVVTLDISGKIDRTVFDMPDAATYSWLVWDTRGKPVNGRALQVGDKIIGETYPVQAGFTMQVFDSDTDGSGEATLWLES